MNKAIDEDVRFRVRPNAFLYALEASRFHLVVALAISFAIMTFVQFRTGLPIGRFMLVLALEIYGLLSLVFFLFLVFLARGIEFVITNKRVIMRVSLMGRVKDNISLPIELIIRIEVRFYNSRYGSVYFECDEAPCLDDLEPYDDSPQSGLVSFSRRADRPRRLASVIVKSGWVPMWLSMRVTSAPLSGFYGFKHFDAFAKLVPELQELRIRHSIDHRC